VLITNGVARTVGLLALLLLFVVLVLRIYGRRS